jgi:hypothetical protein
MRDPESETLILSGCKALEGCELHDTCLRHHHFLEAVYPYQDRFSANQTCRTEDFPHYLLDNRDPEIVVQNIIRALNSRPGETFED